MYRPKIVSVDTNTVSYGDIDFSPVEALGDVSFYGVLTPAELERRQRTPTSCSSTRPKSRARSLKSASALSMWAPIQRASTM